MAVALTAPEAFRFTFPADPVRHLAAAEMLQSGQSTVDDPGERLPHAVTALMRDIGLPNGLSAIGYTSADTGDLVAGALKQQRLLAVAPREATEDDLARIFERSMELWW
jgi:alcohol dehydrogenase class IV